MKKLTYLFFCLSMAAFGQNTLIPDPNFEQALIDLGYDTASGNLTPMVAEYKLFLPMQVVLLPLQWVMKQKLMDLIPLQWELIL